MKPSEYVASVAEELRTNGWIQGHMWNNHGSCVLGAMTAVALKNLRGVYHDSFSQAQRYMQDKVESMGYVSIPAWNDSPARTAGEVQDFLRECQISLKETEG
jgi:hypothetical protein